MDRVDQLRSFLESIRGTSPLVESIEEAVDIIFIPSTSSTVHGRPCSITSDEEQFTVEVGEGTWSFPWSEVLDALIFEEDL